MLQKHFNIDQLQIAKCFETLSIVEGLQKHYNTDRPSTADMNAFSNISNKKILATTIFAFVVIVLTLVLIDLNKRQYIENFAISSSNPTKEEISQDPQTTFTLISTGDIGLVRDVNYQALQRKDPNYPFEKIAGYLKDADITITNLEGPLVKNCPVILSGFTFCGEEINAKGLTFAGIDAASLANNHTTNYGFDGLTQSTNILKSNGIKPFGLEGEIEYLDIKGKKVALVGFVELGNNWPGLNNATSGNTAKLTLAAKQNADVVITAFHWGVEYTHTPTQNQIDLAHRAIDNGADLVLGNHPHWIQNSEIYKGKFITYAQGNTIFDQDWSQKTKEGVIYKFIYKDGKFEKIDERYTIIENNSQPRFASEVETARIKRDIPQE